MKTKIILLIGILLIPSILAGNLKLEIIPHYYDHSREILVYNNESFYDGVSFEIIGKNLDSYWRMLNLTIEDSSTELKGQFPNEFQDLRILQKKTLWMSNIIDINKFKDLNTTIWVGIKGLHEKQLEEIYEEAKLNLIINKEVNEKTETSFFENLGNKIWEGEPNKGLGVLALLILGGGFIFWHFKGGNKLEKWRDNREIKRMEMREYEEGWR